MRKIIVSEFVSLDGVMQAPGGVDEDTDGGFKHGGWTGPYWHDDIGANFMQEIAKADTLLLGRKTWQTHGGAFEPMPVGDPFGDVMNNLPEAEREHWADHAVALPMSDAFLQMQLQPSSCFDDGELRAWD